MMRVSIKDIYTAYKKCHKGKAKSIKTQQYSSVLIDNIFDTHLALQTNAYNPKSYTTFVATNGSKPCDIFTADFSGRVVHHSLVQKLESIINHKFIYHSCANQVGKGTHFGVNELQKMMRKGENKDKYFLQLDIFNFFYNINKKILLAILAKHIKSAIKKRQIHLNQGRDCYRLCTQILQKPQQKNNITNDELVQIPPHKQFKNILNNKGLPIGNLTSQFFGNMYMHELDSFVKHTLKVKYYTRFVDDFVLLGDNKQLQAWQEKIEIFLQKNLRLRDEKILKFINNDNLLLIQSLFASYLEHIKHAKHYNVLQNKFKEFIWLGLFFDKNTYQIKTHNTFATKFKYQVHFFTTIFLDFMVIIQKSKNFITNTIQNQEFSLKYLTNFLIKLQHNNQNYIFVSECGYVHNRLK